MIQGKLQKKAIEIGISLLICITCIFAGCARSEQSTEDSDEEKTAPLEAESAVPLSECDISNAESSYPDIPYVLKINGEEVSYDEFAYILNYYKTAYDNGDATYWNENPNRIAYVQELVLTEIKRNYAIRQEAERRELALTDTELTEMHVNISKTVQSVGGLDTFKALLASMNMTPYAYNSIAETELLSQKLKNDFLENQEILTSDTAIRNILNSGEFIRCKHILIQNDEGDDKSANEELIRQLHDRVYGGEDFSEIMKEYSEDPGLSSNPDGYYFFRGEMTEVFEKAAFALRDNQISDIVETEFGYHIIQRLPKEDAYIEEHFDEIKDNYQSLRMYQLLDKIIEKQDIVFCDRLRNLY